MRRASALHLASLRAALFSEQDLCHIRHCCGPESAHRGSPISVDAHRLGSPYSIALFGLLVDGRVHRRAALR